MSSYASVADPAWVPAPPLPRYRAASGTVHRASPSAPDRAACGRPLAGAAFTMDLATCGGCDRAYAR